jgi:prepilin-type N-terminal cleavage/methylation domain-containing protein
MLPKLRTSRRHGKEGLTLIELLIVIAVLVLLAAIALPSLRTTLKASRQAEAARIVRGVFQSARSRAIGLGKPVVVLVDRACSSRRDGGQVVSSIDKSAAYRLLIMDGALPYTGDSEASVGILYHTDDTLAPYAFPPPMTLTPHYLGANDIPNAICFRPDECGLLVQSVRRVISGTGRASIRPGDTIRFAGSALPMTITQVGYCSGPPDPSFDVPEWDADEWVKVYFRPTESSSEGVLSLPRAFAPSAVGLPFLGSGERREVSFRIERTPDPSFQSPIATVDLPSGSAIDLNYSGIGASGVQFAPLSIKAADWEATNTVDFQRIAIVFGPTGSIDRVYYGVDNGSGAIEFSSAPPAGDLFFLVGKSDGVKGLAPAVVDANTIIDRTSRRPANVLDNEATWVRVSVAGGTTRSSPNRSWNPSTPLPGSWVDLVEHTRGFALNAVDTGLDQ